VVNRFSGISNIIALRRNSNDAVSLAPCRQAEAYWTSLRDGGDIPLRTRIDPRGISNILGHAFMVERLSPSVASIRLAGQHLSAAIGSEARGMPFGLVFSSSSRSSVATALNAVLDTPAIATLELHRAGAFTRNKIAARITLLPLRNPGGHVDRAFGVFVPDERCQGRQMQFDLHDLDLKPVFGPARQERPEPTEIAFATGRKRGAPHLRLVKP